MTGKSLSPKKSQDMEGKAEEHQPLNSQERCQAELVLDMLQKAGVIADDRYVYALHLYKHFSKDRPGVSITITLASEH